MNALTKTRRSTSAKLRGSELPNCFAVATVAAEARTLAKSPEARTVGERNDLQRLARKARRVS
jgi:hypothetical protein